jgi:hypothetical protein
MRVLLMEEKKLILFPFDPSMIIKIKSTEIEPHRNVVKGEWFDQLTK